MSLLRAVCSAGLRLIFSFAVDLSWFAELETACPPFAVDDGLNPMKCVADSMLMLVY